ncbi:MAG: Crp/Fnr family transcriptional regulator [Gemmobacter sp.]
MTPEFRRIALGSRLLVAMPQEVADTLLAASRQRRYPRGGTIFLQGEEARAIYIVAEGWVKLSRIAPNGTEAVVGVFTKGQSFGEAVAFRHDRYPVNAEAVTDCTLIRIEADSFLSMIRARPEIAISILSATFLHLHGLVEQIEQLKARNGAQRVAEFLLDLCPVEQGACTVTLPYDKVLIAGRLGMKPESLSRAFARLREHGVSVRNSVAAISSVETLRDYVAEDPGAAWSRSL